MTTQANDYTAQAAQAAIVARIRKLTAMANATSASESEREQAAAHAQRLMMEHNISVATVEASSDTSTVAKRAKSHVEGVGRYAWQRALMSAIATANFCVISQRERHVYNKDGSGGRWVKDGFELFGREENVAGAEVLFDYLRQTTERLARDYVQGDRHRMLSREATSYKEGCGERLASRVLARHREALAAQRAANVAQSGGTAVALIMEDWAEEERCRNEDFRLGLKEGTTARAKWLAKLESKAWEAAHEALAKLAAVADKAMLTQAAQAAVDDVIGPVGLEGQELADLLRYAVTYPVEAHIRKLTEKPSKPSRARFRSFRGKAGPQRDYAAQSAGRRAADDVSLDRQLDAKARNAGLLKGGR